MLIVASVDRYGRKLDKDEGKRLVRKFYHLEDEESDQEESSEGEEEYDPARGIGVVSSEDDSDDGLDEDVESVMIEEDIPKGNATSRLAAVNLDWDNIRAVDILAVLQSFIPVSSEESVKKVTIYPSEFGKERIQREAVQGPAVFDKPKATDEDEVDTTALRKYQLERLRYFYAIIECTSTSIANVLYKSLDGAELGATANMLDLRFVPDDVTFTDPPRDEATSVPDDHEPTEFVTDALQHSKPKLTWDAEDPERKRLISDAFKRDTETGKWEALLGSSSDEEETEDVRDKYRELLLGVDTIPEEDEIDLNFADDKEDEVEADTPQEETTLEKYKRKERERKHRKREEKQARKEAEKPTDLGFDDPFFTTDSTSSLKRKEKEAKRLAKKAAEDELVKKANELELLMHDESNQSGNHFNINHILKHEKSQKHKKKKKRDAEKEIDLQEGFKMDIHDPRFEDVYLGGEFAIDPNSSAFKKGLRGMEAVLEESRRRKREAEQPEGRKKKRSE